MTALFFSSALLHFPPGAAVATLIEFSEGGDIRFLEGYCLDAIEVFRRHFKTTLATVPDELLRQSKDE